MTDEPHQDPADQDAAGQQPAEFEVRVAPKPAAFLVTGAVLGVLAALVSAWLRGGTEEHSMGSVFGFFAVIFGVAGVALGGLAFLIADRLGRQRAQHIFAVRQDNPHQPGQTDQPGQTHDAPGAQDRARHGGGTPRIGDGLD